MIAGTFAVLQDDGINCGKKEEGHKDIDSDDLKQKNFVLKNKRKFFCLRILEIGNKFIVVETNGIALKFTARGEFVHLYPTYEHSARVRYF